ncbi:phytoene desaturase family protein [Pseudactinotalea sp. Z1732]|uniref:phytoene desaturase family protein n=1 Tax=Micrococcales TaxID=85006 RepID=UPI003C7ABE29
MGERAVTDVVVVGSGPNGLAAAVTMARAGLDVHLYEAEPTLGGGARTENLGLAGNLQHDICSAVHPLALASPFFAEFDLPARGVQFTVPEIAYAQPLDDQPAALAYTDLERTAAALGADGGAWRSLFGPLVQHEPAVLGIGLADMRAIPAALRNPSGLLGALHYGLRVLEQGSPLWNTRFRADAAPALFTGVAAHGIAGMPGLAPAGLGLLLGLLAHTSGWALPVGGSRAIANAMVADLRSHGATIHTDTLIQDYRQLPRARSYLFDTTPGAIARIWGDRLPPRTATRLRRYRHGNAAAKVDFVLSEPVPWRDAPVGRAGTVHVGGSRADMVRAEAQVAAGAHAEQPMVLLSDPAVADPARSRDGLRPLWTYAHVPAGSTADVTEAVTAQIERFAPGFRDVVVDARCTPAAQMSRTNANYVGGDISNGALDLRRILGAPLTSLNPYRAGIPGVYLCSAATPPAPGVHGMCGHHGARWALRERFGIHQMPGLGPR